MAAPVGRWRERATSVVVLLPPYTSSAAVWSSHNTHRCIRLLASYTLTHQLPRGPRYPPYLRASGQFVHPQPNQYSTGQPGSQPLNLSAPTCGRLDFHVVHGLHEARRSHEESRVADAACGGDDLAAAAVQRL